MSFLSWHPLSFLKRHFEADFQVFENSIPEEEIKKGFSIKKLDWDSSFFGKDIFKILFWDEKSGNRPGFPRIQKGQMFAEVPAEAVDLFPVLQQNGFALIETRLTYFHMLDNLPAESLQSRFAGAGDISNLKTVASQAINIYDRYHADSFFSESDTNRYLEAYIENCVNGFAERVFVPDLAEPPASFVALARLKEPLFPAGNLFRIPLTACLPANRGWHYPLCLSALYYAKAQSGKCLVMTTQSTNGAVIHNCEKLGFKLGSIFHIFSKSIS